MSGVLPADEVAADPVSTVLGFLMEGKIPGGETEARMHYKATRIVAALWPVMKAEVDRHRAGEREALRSQLAAADQATEQQRKLVGIHSGAHQICAERFMAMGEAVMAKVVEGGSLAEVVDVVADWMTGCDAWDDDLAALFDRAHAAALLTTAVLDAADATPTEAPR